MVDFTGGTWRSLIDGSEVSAIPDAFVNRGSDNGSGSQNSGEMGAAFEPLTDNWGGIAARLSDLTDEALRAYLYSVDGDGNLDTLIDDTDVSGKSPGDTFSFLSVSLEQNKKYAIVVDAEGSDFTVGFNSDVNEDDYPIREGDFDDRDDSGELEIIGRISDGGSVSQASIFGVNDIGNPDGVLD